MAAYRRVYDSRHLQADCREPGSAPVMTAPTLGNRVWASFLLGVTLRIFYLRVHTVLLRFSASFLILK